MLRLPRSLIVCHRTKSTHSVSSDEYQYMQRTRIPMLHFQASLPRLPIPKLDKTCERYLAAQKPLLIDEAYRKTKDNTDRFLTTDGPKLQQLLKQKDSKNKHTSYISEPWFDMYLRDRVPLPINYNPLLMMNHDPRPAYNDQLLRTTNLVISSLRFMKSLRSQLLEPEVFHLNPAKSDTHAFRTVTSLAPSLISTYVAYAFKAFPLDMSQYQGLFGATRIPETGKDRIYRNVKSRHLLVIRNGHIYSVTVLDQAGNIEQPATLLARFKHVLDDNVPIAENPIGLLTTENRDTWAKIRYHLSEIGNEKALREIDSALFCLCLDDGTINPEHPIPTIKDFLFGNGTNRWFDKSFSLIVSKDGTAGINFEHSWGDGVAVLRYFQEIYKETIAAPFVHPDTLQKDTSRSVDVIKRIEFNLDDRIKDAIIAAQNHHNSIIDSLDMNYLKYDGINKNICKKQRISPDSIMQLGFQLAFYKQHSKFVPTYESCSTAAFRHGRTETMRPCTVATKEFCEAIERKSNPLSSNELRAMMDKCSSLHGQLTKDAAMGQGFDRHLFGLRHMAETNDIPMPCLFQDPAYAAINHNILSTSTLSSPALLAGGFGPVVQDGYGIGYNIQDGFLGSVVTSYKSHRNGREFVDCLRSAYEDIAKVLNNSTIPSK
ncbi:carnitine O-palmitoyltransferase 2, mitochondrial [Malaya genurostris]|uniref:carnitine O-palmitoyltransferase 2, mitochondrial n=1 Tax=Malaya genurostris TaxID=325434 RepID=UPI0026F406AA|nr:carnitine O-palmitoyltransferase 2, mitochondrial [Malaya genurostris]XP_058447495.1 carnitine O-palmitoyltransferase 2, mitochondrial [Malaya genurostris]XP_058447496.1 carnitine O-palmitoyltransferase 2, mitochondrial [Malaya genurostris]XP_058447497.1 carnitine O-palmitoyltransferase 2, mitochondrial [Malaya genurostris]XP_058447498.1 carnitine O-palmitoyltransferase 2, mitochondrial [Malaya genurostris]